MALALLLFATIFGAELLVKGSTKDQVFTEIEELPTGTTALVLGCRRILENDRLNLYFKYRIDQTVALYEAGVLDQIIVSGDNSRKGYDEPTDMKEALVERGVPREIIHPDYAGFSTLDSIVRAKEVFLQEDLIVISQRFHLHRAAYIGNQKGVNVYGSVARDLSVRSGVRTRIRESLARVKTILDVHLLGRQPRFLGDPIHIPDSL